MKQVLYYFNTYKWYTQLAGEEPVSLHPNDVKDTLSQMKNDRPESEGYFWSIENNHEVDRLEMSRTSLEDITKN